MYPLNEFPTNGFVSLGRVADPAACGKLLADIERTREFSPALFLSEADYRANPQHKGVNPVPGRNLIERFDTSFIEQAPAFVAAMTAALGPGYRMLDKKFVVGVPESWMPPWLVKETHGLAVANLGAYVRPEYRDITYFHGIDFHQDIIDFKERRADFITAYVYLADTSESTSPLYVVPRSHAFGATTFPHRITYTPHGRRMRYEAPHGGADDFDYLMLTGPAGSIYFWHSCTLHGTKPHMADQPRISVRMLIESRDGGATLLDRANRAIQGPLSLVETREDLDAAGRARIRGNTINVEDKRKDGSPA